MGCESEMRLISTKTSDLTTIDLLLLNPIIYRRFANLERRDQLRHTRPRPSELNHLSTNL